MRKGTVQKIPQKKLCDMPYPIAENLRRMLMEILRLKLKN
jgi:hypothetical protein